MSPKERLARFALRHIESSTLSERPDLLDAAADFLPEHAAHCRATAAFFRNAEEYQMKLFEKLDLK